MATNDSSSSRLSLSMDTLWSRGSLSGADDAFGSLVDAALGDHGSVFLLDKATLSIHVFDSTGQFVQDIGRSGRGPGELSKPRSLLWLPGDTLMVLDEVNGIVLFAQSQLQEIPRARNIPLPLEGQDACRFRSNYIVTAVHDGKLLHVFSDRGELIRSFGEFLGPTQYPHHRPAFNDRGKVACFPESDVVVTSSFYFSEIRAYRVSDGRLLWTDSIPGSVPYTILTTQQMYSIGQPRSGSDHQYVLRPYSENQVIAQSRRTKDSVEVIKTCVLRIHAPGCMYVSQSLPAIPSKQNQWALLLQEHDFWRASLVHLRQSTTLGSGRPSQQWEAVQPTALRETREYR
ncbi:6-bladed beta-propeller [Gemmatimonas sp. UBA7669]|uniref:6-bladed beta-propeller n=1 Tax=Gemmatimonas sp. UBA7669 TaxID=1946568 RepID=UPI0025BD4C7A|nr:6-bladed beta-propeller [Gemmatimonas sp. UBA7669]